MRRFTVIGVVLCCYLNASAVAQTVRSLYWTDGDSGRLDGISFRLADVDAPETGGVGARGGAKCESERELGYAAKAFMVELTREAVVTITHIENPDAFGRRVVSLAVDGKDIGRLGISAGHLKPYVFDGKRKTMPKPDWCR